MRHARAEGMGMRQIVEWLFACLHRERANRLSGVRARSFVDWPSATGPMAAGTDFVVELVVPKYGATIPDGPNRRPPSTPLTDRKPAYGDRLTTAG